MAEKQFKMLRQDGTGRPYHFSENLMNHGGMVEVYMTRAEILAAEEGVLGRPIAASVFEMVEAPVVESVTEVAAPVPKPVVAQKPALPAKPVQKPRPVVKNKKPRPVVKNKKPVVATRKPDVAVVDPDAFIK